MIDKYIIKNGKKLQYGITSGSCAAAAAKAATIILKEQKNIENVTIDTPKGWEIKIDITDQKFTKRYAECSVIKFAGDDPDVTDKMKIYAKVYFINEDRIEIKGGPGIGIVTKKGLAVDIGKPAINPVPLKMINDEVKNIKPDNKGVVVEISVPDGEKIAKKTFNPKLGIKGGISIIGTTGIIEPMSEEAYKETINIKIRQSIKNKTKTLIFVPGNYGFNFAIKNYELKEDKIIQMGNYIGYIIDQCKYYKIKNIIIIGSIAKLIKVAGGIFNTYSKVADARLEILASNYMYYYQNHNIFKKIFESNTVEEAVNYIKEKEFYKKIVNKIKEKCTEYVNGLINFEISIFSMHKGLLAETDGLRESINNE
jgi:cobalt-precorrin-5B (C1)-methyltransferase